MAEFKPQDFQIRFHNVKAGESKPAMHAYSHFIAYIAHDEDRFVGARDDGSLKIVDQQDRSLWFRSAEQAETRLARGLANREFESVE